MSAFIKRKSTLLLREAAEDLYSGKRRHFQAGNIEKEYSPLSQIRDAYPK